MFTWRRSRDCHAYGTLHTPIFIIHISCYLPEHHGEVDAGGSRSQETTSLHIVGNGKEIRKVTIESDLSAIVLEQLDHNLLQIFGVTKSLQDEPYFYPAY